MCEPIFCFLNRTFLLLFDTISEPFFNIPPFQNTYHIQLINMRNLFNIPTLFNMLVPFFNIGTTFSINLPYSITYINMRTPFQYIHLIQYTRTPFQYKYHLFNIPNLFITTHGDTSMFQPFQHTFL